MAFVIYLPTQARFPIERERVTYYESKLQNFSEA